MNLTNRVEKLEQQAGQHGTVRFVAHYPPKMAREEWDAYARAQERSELLDGESDRRGGVR